MTHCSEKSGEITFLVKIFPYGIEEEKSSRNCKSYLGE